MARIVGLPKLSPTMEEGTLARWAKKEGDRIAVDDLIAEVETDKATMEWRAFDPGVLLKIIAQEGAVLEPDAPVAIIGEAGEDVGPLLAQLGQGGAKPAAAEEKPAPQPVAEKKAAPPPAPAGPSPAGPSPAGPSPAGPSPARPDGRVLASPLVRRVAREHDVDLHDVRGSGPGGRIVKRDLDAYIAQPRAAAPAAQAGPRPGPRVERLSSMRRTIARRLSESKQTVPHFYLTMDVDAGPLVEARAQINAELERDGEKVSVNDLVMKACAVALRRMPEVNASYAGDSIHYHQVVDISMAVAIPDGLVTPVIRDADKKGIREIAREARELAGRAREKKLQPEEMTNGTFSVSNLGMFGIEDFAAVINPPEGAILAVGTVRDEPVVSGGRIEPGKRMRMTLSCDHRVIDGALGARWLAVLRSVLEKPVLMLL